MTYRGSVGASLHLSHSENVWRVPLAFQLVPAGLMVIGLFTVKVGFSALHLLPRDPFFLLNLSGISSMDHRAA